MFLKRLELQGFKSFPNRTKVEFNKGVTAIVGPNGSGKSNILDAILWVLGEQSAKTLRGVKMEDVIFGGTENRKPMSYAEVSIVIDNEKKYFNVEYDEVIVTRKVYRSGDSEYFINNKTCRLKDITELFMDTGIGKDGYSIISQGKVEEIVSNKGSDRKQFFDEAVGIVKYRSKKGEALNNLKKEKENLERVELIINELATQLEPLKIESEKAKEYVEYRDELKEIEVTRFIRDVSKIQENINLINKDIAVSNLDLNRLEIQIKKEKEKQEEIDKNIQDAENEKDKLIKLLNDSNIEVNNFDNEIKTTKESILYLQKEETRLKEEIKKQNLKIEFYENEIKNILSNIDSKKIEKKTLEIELQNFENTQKEAIEDIEKLDNDKERLTQQYINLKEESNEQNLKLNTFNQSLIFKSTIIQEKENEILNTKNKIKDKQLKVEVNKKRKDMLTKDLDEINITSYKEEQQLKIEKENMSKNSDILKTTNNEYQTVKNKMEFLQNMEQENEGLSHSVKYLLNKKMTGVIDIVGNLIEVKEKYLLAIDTALGGALQNLVVEDENVAKNCIEELKKSKKGRATFLPITSMKSRMLTEDLKEYKGFLGLGINLISFDKKYRPIFENLLGNVVVVTNLDEGIKISKKYKATFRIVTLDGQFLNIGGSMVGGSKNHKNNSLLTRKQELTYAKEKLETLENSKKSLEDEEKLIYNKITHFEERLKSYSSKYNDLTFLIKEIDIKNANIEKEVLQDTNNKKSFEMQIDSLKKEKIELLKNVENVKKELEAIKVKQENIDKELLTVNVDYEKGKNIKDSYFKTLSEFKVQISEINSFINTNENKIVENKNNINDIKNNIKLATEEIGKCQLEIENKNKTIEKLKITIDNKVIEKENNFNLLSKIKSNLEDLKSLVKKIYLNFETLNKDKHNVETTKLTLNNKKVALDEKLDNLHGYIWNKYDMTYINAKEQPYIEKLINNEDLDKREKILKAKMKNLGEVNVNSIDRYVNDKKRFDFLNTQRDDIIKSEQDILKLIDNLTFEMEEKFRTQFNIIRENFSYVFKELFGGGEAKLVLSDEENILESNIEIKAQPPGKKLNHMSLLSGGEKSLTAISLLFAILRMKPSPFCILDEVESALDDSNVTKYGEYLQKFTQFTQFIAITHRNGTMESADTLYGVTMQEKGISTLVSVEFN